MLRITLVVLCYIGMTLPAFAYIDPSLGAFVLQGLMAAVATVAVAMTTMRRSISSFFSRIVGRVSPGKQGENRGEAAKGED